MKRLKRTILVMTFPLVLFFILTLLIPFLNFSFSKDNISTPSRSGIKIIGHRGSAGTAPENTLTAFQKGIDQGADMLELDVHLAADDSIIVMHDFEVERTTNGKGEIENLTYSYIKSLDAGSKFNKKFKDEKVPTLDEVFNLVNGRKTVLVELKWPRKGIYKNLVNRVVECVRKHNAEKWVILQSFETEYLKEIKENAPEITFHQLVFGKSGFMPIYFDRKFHIGKFHVMPGVSSVNIFYIYLNKKLVETCHKNNLTVYVFTIDSPEKMAKAINIGADGIITNHPEILSAMLKAK